MEREETRGGDGKVVEEKERDEGKRREGEEWEGLDRPQAACSTAIP